jgi:hypothetical protein
VICVSSSLAELFDLISAGDAAVRSHLSTGCASWSNAVMRAERFPDFLPAAAAANHA